MKKIPILICFFCLLIPSVLWAGPLLLFSDLVDGPRSGWEGSETKGAAVTIWGKGFGESGTITCAGQSLSSADSDQVAEWGTTGTENGIPRGLERTTFWLNSSMTAGAQTISITVGGETSNTLSFYVRTTGSIYFIAISDGDDSYDGTRSAYVSGTTGPWKSPRKALPSNGSTAAGDVTYIRAGTYTEAAVTMDDDDAFMRLRNDIGTANTSIAVVGYPGELPEFDISTATRGLVSCETDESVYTSGEADYIVVSKLKAADGGGAITVWGRYWRVIGCVFEDDRLFHDGIVRVSTAENSRIYGSYFNNCGHDIYGHNIYIKAENYLDDLIETVNIYVGWNEFYSFDCWNYEPPRGGVIEIQTHGDTASQGYYTNHIYIHDNYFHDGTGYEWLRTATSINNIFVWNNIVHDITGGIAGTALENGPSGQYLYNNVIMNIGDAGDPMFNFISGGESIDLKNNIIYPRSEQTIFSGMDAGSTVTSDYDAYVNVAAPSGAQLTITNPIDSLDGLTVDPFTNSSTGDFTLNSNANGGALLLDAGTSDVETVLEYDLPGSVTQAIDYAGVQRPQNIVYDIGAYEYDEGGSPPASTVTLSGATLSGCTVQ